MAVMTSVNDNREYEQKMIINAISQLGRATIEKRSEERRVGKEC